MRWCVAIKSNTVYIWRVSNDLRIDLGDSNSPTCAAAWRFGLVHLPQIHYAQCTGSRAPVSPITGPAPPRDFICAVMLHPADSIGDVAMCCAAVSRGAHGDLSYRYTLPSKLQALDLYLHQIQHQFCTVQDGRREARGFEGDTRGKSIFTLQTGRAICVPADVLTPSHFVAMTR